jgi:hypothetical protein
MRKFKFILFFIILSHYIFSQTLDLHPILEYNTEESASYDIFYNSPSNTIQIKNLWTDELKTFRFDQNLEYQFIEESFLLSSSSLLNVAEPLPFQTEVISSYGEFFSLVSEEKTIFINYVPSLGIAYHYSGSFPNPQFVNFETEITPIYALVFENENVRVFELDRNFYDPYNLITPIGLEELQWNGSTYYVIPFSFDENITTVEYFLRIYDEDFNLVFQSQQINTFGADRFLSPGIIDLNDDGNSELILFGHPSYNNHPGFNLNCFDIIAFEIKESTINQRILSLDPNLERLVGDDVLRVQEFLLKLGYDLKPDGADGYYGPKTFNAVKEFQETHGILPTGVVDNATWDFILNP